MIKNEGNKFYVEVFYPYNHWKFMGCVAFFKNIKVFVTHVKHPDKHFYVKGLGYPVNYALLCRLHSVGVQYVVVPENGKRGFNVYIAPISDYIRGVVVSEPQTEEQRVIPLKDMNVVNHDYDDVIKKMLEV